MTEPLRPCPFCGSKEIIIGSLDPLPIHLVRTFSWYECSVCKATGPISVVLECNLWNFRHSDARVEMLIRCIEECQGIAEMVGPSGVINAEEQEKRCKAALERFREGNEK